MTNAEPTPVFRRFPWVQLVFCVACLSMAAWTWMRYSYAWPVTPHDLKVTGDYARHSPYRNRYVALKGLVYASDRKNRAYMAAEDDPCRDPARTLTLVDVALRCGPTVVRGRVWYWEMQTGSGLSLVTRASRFYPASVGGLVVGAMGCFIFGLYLRRWLRERKAAA